MTSIFESRLSDKDKIRIIKNKGSKDIILSDKEPDDEKITQGCPPQPRIDPVQHAAVTGEEVAGIFHARLPFEHRLAQVTQDGEDGKRRPQRGPLPPCNCRTVKPKLCHKIVSPAAVRVPKRTPPTIALPGFFRTDPPAERVFPKATAHKISPHIRQPDGGKDNHQPPHPTGHIPQVNQVGTRSSPCKRCRQW